MPDFLRRGAYLVRARERAEYFRAVVTRIFFFKVDHLMDIWDIPSERRFSFFQDRNALKNLAWGRGDSST